MYLLIISPYRIASMLSVHGYGLGLYTPHDVVETALSHIASVIKFAGVSAVKNT